MNSDTSGSCLCGQIKFVIQGAFDAFFLCHCKHCQKDSGSAHSANLFLGKGLLTWVAGEAFAKTFRLPNTRHTKSFCQDCGSALPYLLDDDKLIVVPAGSLDTPLSRKPDGHLFCRSKAPWDEGLESVKQFPKLPG